MADIEKRTLGRTGAEVTTLGYGAMELRGGGRGREVPDDVAGRILNAVLDAGINLIDTSIDYGLSEERIGKFISHRRDEFFLASRCGCAVPQPTDPNERFPHVFTRENIVAGVKQSLRRMQTDHLDLVQLHASPSKETMEENGVVETLKDLQAQGKVRFIGASGTLPNIADQIALGVFDVFQIPYSCVERKHEEMISLAKAAGAGVFVRGGAAKGAPSDSTYAQKRNPDGRTVWEKANLDDLLEGGSAMEFVLRFTAMHPAMSTTIVGTVNPDHLAANLAAVAKGPLSADVYDEAKRRLADAGSAPEA